MLLTADSQKNRSTNSRGDPDMTFTENEHPFDLQTGRSNLNEMCDYDDLVKSKMTNQTPQDLNFNEVAQMVTKKHRKENNDNQKQGRRPKKQRAAVDSESNDGLGGSKNKMDMSSHQ